MEAMGGRPGIEQYPFQQQVNHTLKSHFGKAFAWSSLFDKEASMPRKPRLEFPGAIYHINHSTLIGVYHWILAYPSAWEVQGTAYKRKVSAVSLYLLICSLSLLTNSFLLSATNLYPNVLQFSKLRLNRGRYRGIDLSSRFRSHRYVPSFAIPLPTRSHPTAHQP